MKKNSLALAIFRISFSLIYFIFLYRLYSLEVYKIEPMFLYLIFFQTIFNLFILFGYKYNLFKILFFISTLFLLYIFHQFNGANIYHPPVTFRLLAILNIFILLLPLNATLSVDKLLSNHISKLSLVKNFNYIFITLVVGFIYLDGATYKSLDFYNWILHSDTYFLKVYLGENEYIRDNFIVDFILNHTFVAQFLVSSVYLYQLSFIFISLFFKRIKIYFFILGISLHLGMAIFFDFSFIVLFTLLFYIPLLPNRFYYKIFSFFRGKKDQYIKVYYDSNCMVCTKYIRLIKLFDFKNKIKLTPKNLKNESEIYIFVTQNRYKGILGFQNLFRESFVTYPLYMLLKIDSIYKMATYLYSKFSEKRTSFSCKLDSGYMFENRYILFIYLSLSVIGLMLVKFKIFTKIYLLYAIFVGIYPINVFIIKSHNAIYYTSFYLEDIKNQKIYIDKSFKEHKYITYYLNNNYNKLDKQKYAHILKDNYMKICKRKQKFLFKDIENLKYKENLKKELNAYLISSKIKIRCKDLR